MVITLTVGAAQDVGDEVQTSGAGIGVLDCSVNLALGRTLVDIDALVGLGLVLVLGVVGNESALDLVRVDGSRLLAVGLGDLVLIGIGTNLEEVCSAGTELDTYALKESKMEKKEQKEQNAMLERRHIP